MGRKSKATKRRSPPIPPLPERHEEAAPSTIQKCVEEAAPVAQENHVAFSKHFFSRNPWLFAAALFAVVFLAYKPAWRGDFIWDDNAHVTRPELQSLHGLYRIWFDFGATLQYYPLLHSAFWLEHKLWGDTTLGYHIMNLSLHVLAALLVAMLLRKLAIPGAWLAAAIFALHPVQVESVAWITELKNLLSAVFYLGAAIAYIHFDQKRQLRWYFVAFGLFVLALASKTVTGTLPAALLVVFWWQRGTLSWKKDVLPLAPFFLLGACAGMITARWEVEMNRCVGPEFDLTSTERILIAGRAAWFHLGKLLWPVNLAFIYPLWHIDSADWRQYLFPLAAAAMLAALWAIRRRTRAPLAAVLLFGGTLVPVLGFFNLYTFRYSFVANHYQYLASLGIIALFSAGATMLLKRLGGPRRVLGQLGCVGLLTALTVLTWRQSLIYADNETLYQTTIDQNPDCSLAYSNLGLFLFSRGQTDQAIADYQKALEIKPDLYEAHNNLGFALAARGQIDEAIAHYRKALESRPNLVEGHHNLGLALVARGQFDEAIAHYRKALELKPDGGVHHNLASALADSGQLDEAIEHYRKALEFRPDVMETYSKLGKALISQGRVNEAIAIHQQALKFRPDLIDSYNNLGQALFSAGRVEEAITNYRKALEIEPRQARALNNLGLAFAANGKFEEATSHYRKALEIMPDYFEAHYNFGLALAECDQFDEAIAHYRKALEIMPNSVDALDKLGYALFAKGRVDEAIGQYRRAVEIKPNYAEGHHNLGFALASHGQVDEAIAHYRKALEISPNYFDAHYHLGIALAGRGQKDQALEHFQKALDLASTRKDKALANEIRDQINKVR